MRVPHQDEYYEGAHIRAEDYWSLKRVGSLYTYYVIVYTVFYTQYEPTRCIDIDTDTDTDVDVDVDMDKQRYGNRYL